MAAVWYRSRALLRHQRGTTLLLVALVALAGGVVIATVAGARRTADALPDFLDHYRGQDVSAFVFYGALAPQEEDALVGEIEALPQWEATGVARPVVVSLALDGAWVTQVAIALERGPYRTGWDRPILVAGRLPDPEVVGEVAVNEPLADALDLEPGDTFPLRTVTPGALDDASAGVVTRDPDGEDATMTVAGIIRRPVDLSADQPVTSGPFGRESWLLEVGPAFSERFDGELANYGIGVQGRARPGQSRALANAIVDAGGSVVEVQEGSEVREETESIQRAVDFERNALLLFALVTLLTAAALVGQIISRQAVIDLDDDDVLRAAGLRRRERATVPLPRAVLIAVLGGAGAAVIAAGASGIFPVGLARRAELDPGFRPDGACIAVGVLLLVVAVLVPAAAAAWRGTAGAARGGGARRSPRVSTAAAAAAGVGAPVPTVAGVRMALERGRGRTAVPVTGAIVATTAGVLTVTALLVLATSIDRMVDTPALQGWTWDTTVGNLNDPESVEATIDALAANPLVASFIGFSSGPLVIDGEASYAGALGRGDPSAGPEVIEGRMPRAVDEVVVGRLTLADLDKEIGDLVELSPAADAPAQTARIVGTAILPAALDPSLTLGRGVLLTGAGVSRVYGDPRFVPNTFLVRFTEGTTTAEGVRSLQEDFPETAGGLGLADDAVNLSRVQGLPRLLAALVALLGLGTLTNTLATSVRRHRRDLATLSALGMRRRQLGTTVAWQATTFAAVALVVGVPLGVALGRTAWRLLIESLGAVAEPSVPVPSLLVVIVGSVVTANVVAALPARSAARTRPAAILHAE